MKSKKHSLLRALLKQKAALVAAIFITLLTIVSIFGYLIAPDSTPYANEQHIELAFRKPGFSVEFLNLPLQNSEKSSVIQEILNGQPPAFNRIPVFDYSIMDDSIYIETYTGTIPNEGVEMAFFIPEIVDQPDSGSMRLSGDGYDYLRQGIPVHLSRREAKSMLIEHHISKQLFLLGTDRFGRDVLSQLIIGSRVSLSVGFISVIIALLIGVTLGAIAGFFGGWIDKSLLWLISVFWSMPTVLLVMAITFALGKGFWQVFVAIGLTFWVDIARMVRGQVLSIREREYIEAARSLGYPRIRILINHVLPGVSGPVIVTAASAFASAILIEAGLSFLGIGVQPPMPSWGTMIKEYYGHLVLDSAYLAIIPGLAILVLVLSFMLIGNALRDILDVKQSLS